MGLRAASVRHSNATVMAPALTEANQTDNFKLEKSSHIQTVVAVNGGHTKNGGCSPLVQDEQRLMCKELVESMVVTKSHTQQNDLINNANNIHDDDALDNLNTLAFVSEIVKVNGGQVNNNNNQVTGIAASDMNNQSMDQEQKPSTDNNTMGLQNMDQKEMSSSSSQLKEKQHAMATNDVAVDEQLLMIATGSDLGTNVDDFMQVLKNIEVGSGSSGQTGADNNVVGDAEIAFPISTVNLTNFCQNLLNDVDVLSYEEANEEQMVVDHDSIVDTKEVATQEKLDELKRTQTKLERRYEFLLRRLQKIQARDMGQHVSAEVAGVFELTYRNLKRAKERPQPPLLPPTEIKQETIDDLSILQDLPSTSSTIWNAPPSTQQSDNTNKIPVKGLTTSSMKNLVHKLEKTKMMQSSATLYRNKIVSKYFGAGSIETSSSVNSNNNFGRNNCVVLPPNGTEIKQELERVAGLLETELGIIQHQIDSDATASSSGAESCDEMQTFNNPHQQYCTIAKRASWKFAQERAAIASRWTWTQWQISDLEYRIRQLNELHKQIRNSKGPVIFGNISPSSPRTTSTTTNSPGSVNGYRGVLPGATKIQNNIIDDTLWLHNNGNDNMTSTNNNCSSSSNSNNTGNNNNNNNSSSACSRTKPFVKSVFRNRRLLQTTGLHVISKKWRPSSVRCNCVPGMPPCALCTGRTDPTYPKESRDLLTVQQQIGYLDAGYHPKISFPEDVNQSLHYDALLKMPEWQQKTARSMTKALKLAVKQERLDKGDLRTDRRLKKPEYRRKYNKLLKASTASALSAKIKNRLARGRKPNRNKTQAQLLARLNRKKPAEVALAQLQALSGNDIDANELDEYDNVTAASGSKHPSPAASPPPYSSERLSFNREYRRNRIDSYDIDNIVIPYSVAASTRVEKLPYKEILTPKWRVIELEPNSQTIENNSIPVTENQENEEEDISDEVMLTRHEKCEIEERKKFMSYIKFPLTGPRSRANRRTDSRAESSGANTPDPMSPHTGEIGETSNSPLTSPPATPMSTSNVDDLILNHSIGTLRRRTASQSKWARERETRDDLRCITPDHVEVPPYENRDFPLSDTVYEKMLGSMPEGHPCRLELRTNEDDDDDYPSPSVYPPPPPPVPMDSETSTDSILGEEDPNDPEWMVVKRMRDRPKR